MNHETHEKHERVGADRRQTGIRVFRAFRVFRGPLVALGIWSIGPAAQAQLADAVQRQDKTAVAALLKQHADANAPGADGSSALHWAVRYQDVETARALIAGGADVKLANRYGATPLSLAAADGDIEMLKLLIAAGADVNSADRAGESVLMIAAREGTVQAVTLLLDAGAQVDAREPHFLQTALMIAVREDHPEVVDLLIRRKADVNARTRVAPAPAPRPPGAGGGSHGVGIVRGGIPEQGARAAQPGGLTPLLYAARDGRTKSVELLLAAGAQIDLADANGITPLMMALTNNKLPTARLLIDRGANVNAVDWYGRTPLFDAVEVRNLEVNGPGHEADNGVDRPAALELIRLLLDKGANPNARTKEYYPDRRFITPLGSLAWVDVTGKTPFFQAALSGDVEAMRLLLRYKADPNLATFNKTTPLMAAAGVNWVINQTWTEAPDKLLEAVRLCVELGGDVNGANSMGLRAIHGAANRGSEDIIRFLVEKGARPDAKDNEGRTPFNWAEGVFLATNAPAPKPGAMALLKQLEQSSKTAEVKPAGQGSKKSGAASTRS